MSMSIIIEDRLLCFRAGSSANIGRRTSVGLGGGRNVLYGEVGDTFSGSWTAVDGRSNDQDWSKSRARTWQPEGGVGRAVSHFHS